MKLLRYFALVWMVLFAAAGAAAAETEMPPALTEDGFLMEPGEYIVDGGETGPWVYISQDLSIRIDRYQREKPKLVWFETTISTKGERRLETLLVNKERPGTRFQNPVTIARENNAVLAINDDFFGYRIYNKETVGIVIRDGVVYGTKTKKKITSHIPNLDLLAVFADGSMRAFYCNEHTAEEYLDMGVTDTYCFGPVVIKDGEIGQQIQAGKYTATEPRNCLGMIEPGRYVVITVEGRSSDSKGTGLKWVAERMQEMGVTQAINLDGGQTVALVFRGRLLNKFGSYNNHKKLRSVSSMIAIGQTEIPEE